MPRKPFAIGEGGLVTTTDDELAGRLARLTNFGFEDGVVDGDVGLNAKLAEWPAATALAALDRFGEVLACRRATATRMLADLVPHGYDHQSGSDGAAWQFVPVLAPSEAVRAAALETARRNHIELRTYYSVPLHRMPAFAAMPVAGDLRRTEVLGARVLSLPMSDDLSDASREAIVESLVAATRAGVG